MTHETGSRTPALPSPPTAPGDWAERIDEAKKARAMGRALRKGKPVTFGDRRAQRRVETSP